MDVSNIIQGLIKKGKLESTLFVSTTEYLNLIVTQSCSICNNCKVNKWKYKIKVNRFLVKVIITCKQYYTSIIYTNESAEMNFSKVVAGAGLLGGVNREEWRNMLAFCGITKQCGKRQYFEHQDVMLKDIVQAAHQ